MPNIRIPTTEGGVEVVNVATKSVQRIVDHVIGLVVMADEIAEVEEELRLEDYIGLFEDFMLTATALRQTLLSCGLIKDDKEKED